MGAHIRSKTWRGLQKERACSSEWSCRCVEDLKWSGCRALSFELFGGVDLRSRDRASACLGVDDSNFTSNTGSIRESMPQQQFALFAT